MKMWIILAGLFLAVLGVILARQGYFDYRHHLAYAPFVSGTIWLAGVLGVVIQSRRKRRRG